jgi:excisionase family DNA binding protein
MATAPADLQVISDNGKLRLRPKDVARLYSISTQPVYSAIYRGELPAVRFGQRTWLIRPEDAARWIEENSTSNAA